MAGPRARNARPKTVQYRSSQQHASTLTSEQEQQQGSEIDMWLLH